MRSDSPSDAEPGTESEERVRMAVWHALRIAFGPDNAGDFEDDRARLGVSFVDGSFVNVWIGDERPNDVAPSRPAGEPSSAEIEALAAALWDDEYGPIPWNEAPDEDKHWRYEQAERILPKLVAARSVSAPIEPNALALTAAIEDIDAHATPLVPVAARLAELTEERDTLVAALAALVKACESGLRKNVRSDYEGILPALAAALDLVDTDSPEKKNE